MPDPYEDIAREAERQAERVKREPDLDELASDTSAAVQCEGRVREMARSVYVEGVDRSERVDPNYIRRVEIEPAFRDGTFYLVMTLDGWEGGVERFWFDEPREAKRVVERLKGSR